VRFEKRLGFKMDRHTEALARSAVDMDIVSRLTGVRIRDELIYILSEEKPFNAIKRLYGLGALSRIGINILMDKAFTSNMRKALNSLKRIKNLDGGEVREWRLLLAVLLDNKTARGIESWCLRMKIRKKDMYIIKNTVTGLSKARKGLGEPISDKVLYNRIKKYPGELLAICYSWGGQYSRNIRKFYTRLSRIRLEIGGEDLKKMGYKPSPAFKKVLDRIFFMKLDGKVSGRKQELEAAAKIIEKYDKDMSQLRSRAI
jgi:tRNA nucleotidyltransferase (CCA-adding enzyme)